jgi:hypothetical protein
MDGPVAPARHSFEILPGGVFSFDTVIFVHIVPDPHGLAFISNHASLQSVEDCGVPCRPL